MTPFLLTAITNDAAHARRCDAAGVDRIGVDIERIGKHARQHGLANARISDHELVDLIALRGAVRNAQLFARLNPLHDGTPSEIEKAVAYGARVLMLPQFTGAGEVERFVRLADRRAVVTLLLETADAVANLDDILSVPGIDEVMVGLNDLALSLGMSVPFAALASDCMDRIAASVRHRGLPFGFGGLARAMDCALPMPADLVVAQHPRLGSQAAWLSRSFFGKHPETVDIGPEVTALRARIQFWREQSPESLALQRIEMRRRVMQLTPQ